MEIINLPNLLRAASDMAKKLLGIENEKKSDVLCLAFEIKTHWLY